MVIRQYLTGVPDAIISLCRQQQNSMNINIVNKHFYDKAKSKAVDVYCGRGSVLGNPYSHKLNTQAKFVVSSRDEAIRNYREYFYEEIKHNENFLNELRRIYVIAKSGEVNLVCFCYPKSCHCDVIKEFILSKG
jgi:hypothetical protein